MNRERCHKRWLKRWNKAWRRACSRAYSNPASEYTYKEDIEMCNPWMFFWEELEDLKHRKNDKR